MLKSTTVPRLLSLLRSWGYKDALYDNGDFTLFTNILFTPDKYLGIDLTYDKEAKRFGVWSTSNRGILVPEGQNIILVTSRIHSLCTLASALNKIIIEKEE